MVTSVMIFGVGIFLVKEKGRGGRVPPDFFEIMSTFFSKFINALESSCFKNIIVLCNLFCKAKNSSLQH